LAEKTKTKTKIMRLYSEHTIQKKPHYSGRLWEPYAAGAHVAIVALLALSLLSAGLYVYSVNRSAVQGYAIRTLEQELKTLKKANMELRIHEAEAQSLSRVEAGSFELRMEKAEASSIVNIQSNAVAFR
jgi:hypothetical protein